MRGSLLVIAVLAAIASLADGPGRAPAVGSSTVWPATVATGNSILGDGTRHGSPFHVTVARSPTAPYVVRMRR